MLIDYTRISLTDRCNLRCRYCVPETGVKKYPHSDILRFEEIYYLIDILKDLGIKKFRFTGGEPLVRRGVLDFFENVNLDGFYLTTNLAVKSLDIKRINKLKIKGINISLDTLNPEKYRWLTRGGDLNTVLNNIKNINIDNIKLNTILMKDFNEDEVMDIINFALEIKAIPRFIEKMDFAETGLQFISLEGLKKYLIKKNIIETESCPDKNSVASYHKMNGARGIIGFITPISNPFCANCNKIRFKANGDIKLCLFGDNVKVDKSNMKESIKNIILMKPQNENGDSSILRTVPILPIMANIGG